MSETSTAPSSASAEASLGSSWVDIAIVLWAVGGVIALLVKALFRLTPYAVEAFEMGLTPMQWTIAIAWTLMNAYMEGYRGFQKAFSPRVIARAAYLAKVRPPLYVVLAPLHVMALFHATKKRLIVAWALVVMIVGLIIIIRMLPQPWRGIVDVGVVVGLAWGMLSLVWFLAVALLRGEVPDDAGLPESAQAATETRAERPS